jgi:hypothetical protein
VPHANTDAPQRQLLALALLRELNVHMLAEEAVVYPVLAEQVWVVRGDIRGSAGAVLCTSRAGAGAVLCTSRVVHRCNQHHTWPLLHTCYTQIGEEHLRDHAVDEHDSLKLFASDLEGMKAGDEGYDAKLHQLMEVC